MGSISTAPRNMFWKTQLPVDYIDTSLTINDWETIVADLSDGKPAKLLAIIVQQDNNGAAAEDIELEITMAHPVTGVMTTYTWSASLASAIPQWGIIEYHLAAGDFTPTLTATLSQPLWTGANTLSYPFTSGAISLIRVRQTSAVDVVSAQIEVNIIWEKLTVVEV